MKTKLQIKHILGSVLFEYETEDNTIKKTVEEAVRKKINLSGSDLRGSNLRGSDLSGSNLSGSNLSGSNLSGSDLRGSNLRWSNLIGSDLSGSNLRWSNLIGSDLIGSDLSGSDLRGSDLSGSKLNGSKLSGEKLEKEPIQIIGLKYFVMITPEQIKIGCEHHKVDEWKEFSDERILEMDGKEGLKWWKENKEFIFDCHKKHLED